MEYANNDATANNKGPARELPVGRATPQAQRRTLRVQMRTRWALRRRPPADQCKCQGQPFVEGPQPEVSPPGEPTACGKCGDTLLVHMRAAAGKILSRLRVHERRVMDLLHLRWHTALLWVWAKPRTPDVKKADLQLLHEVLHDLA